MLRPLMKSRIGDLEDMFAASSGEPEVLLQLERELQFRQVPRALALLEKVQQFKATAGAVGATEPMASLKAVVAPAKQGGWVQNSAAPAAQLSLLGPRAAAQLERQPMVSASLPVYPPAKSSRPIPPALIQAAAPEMSLADACRLLNVATGASWESIEQARRVAVQKSSPISKGTPDANRSSALAAARLVNAAYAALSTARCASKAS